MIKPSQCLYCYETVSFNVIFPISWNFFLLITISYNILFLSFLCNITISTYVLVQSGSVQFSRSVMYNSLWPSWTASCQASLSIINSRGLSKLISIESVMPTNHLILCCLLRLLPSIFPSIRVFSNESALRSGWPKYWSFSFNINPSKEYSGLIPFRMDWLDLLVVQGTLKSLRQYHSSKASILWHSAFFFLAFILFYFICSEFCHTLKWKGLRFTCLPHPDPPSHLPPHLLPPGPPRAPGPSACLMHPTWAGDLFLPW